MQLIYFSAVPWASFRQRPHEFAQWCHERLAARVLWVEPYPVRLPRWQDAMRPSAIAGAPLAIPPWLEVIVPTAVPAEPLALGRLLNRSLVWPTILGRLRSFADADARTVLAVGKPSDLALQAMLHLPELPCVYDAMDDFPAFHQGLARKTSARIEHDIAQRCTACLTSSSLLAARLRELNANVHWVPNGLAHDRMPAAREPVPDEDSRSFGYIGTLGAWFDWPWLAELAASWPERQVEIYGPLYRQPDVALPPNVRLFPPLPHEEALRKMAGLAAGLIPFLRNELTASVDPVKYYEYRGLGLPVLSTPFGEMRQRGNDSRVLLTEQPASRKPRIAQLLADGDTAESVAEFRRLNAWDTRFEPLAALLDPKP